MTDVLYRSFPSTVERVSAEVLSVRAVPYGVKASVVEVTPTGVESYEEAFAPGAFVKQATSTEPGVVRRVNLVDEHEGGSGKLGVATALRDDASALAADFFVLPSRRDDLDGLLRIGVDAVSIGFVPLANGTRVQRDGTRLRTRAHLVHVALVAQGAYPGAEVLAFRDAADVAEAEAAAEAEAERARRELAAYLDAEKAKHEAWLAKVASHDGRGVEQ